MKEGVALPKLDKISPKVIQLASKFDVVSPLDWLSPSELVFNGVTSQHAVINTVKPAITRGHCLVPCKTVYQPTIWGGNCRGKKWRRRPSKLDAMQKKSVILNYVDQTIRRFHTVQEWDLTLANVSPTNEIRLPWWEELLDRAILAKPHNHYYLDELLGTCKERWETIFKMAQTEGVKGVGVQIHANDDINLEQTLELLEHVLKEAYDRRIPVNLSEVGYWVQTQAVKEFDAPKLLDFMHGVYGLSKMYNVNSFIWWGLVTHTPQSNHLHNTMLGLFDEQLNPTLVFDTLCDLVPSLSRYITPILDT